MSKAPDQPTQPQGEPPAKRGRGRPPTGKALSNKERQRLFRQRRAAAARDLATSHVIEPKELIKKSQRQAQELEELRQALDVALGTIQDRECKWQAVNALSEKAWNRVKELEDMLSSAQQLLDDRQSALRDLEARLAAEIARKPKAVTRNAKQVATLDLESIIREWKRINDLPRDKQDLQLWALFGTVESIAQRHGVW